MAEEIKQILKENKEESMIENQELKKDFSKSKDKKMQKSLKKAHSYYSAENSVDEYIDIEEYLARFENEIFTCILAADDSPWAEDFINFALTLDRKNATLYILKGILLMKTGYPEKAKPYLKKAYKLIAGKYIIPYREYLKFLIKKAEYMEKTANYVEKALEHEKNLFLSIKKKIKNKWKSVSLKNGSGEKKIISKNKTKEV